jgi:hypothetical protein
VSSFTVSAHDVPDMTRTGTISIIMHMGETLVPGGELTVYHVGVIDEDDGNYSFIPAGAFSNCVEAFQDVQSPELAQQLANEIREVSAKQIVDVMGVQAVNVVDEANLPTTPSSPNMRNTAIIGFAWGALIAIVLILFKYLMDDSVKSPDDVEAYLGLTVLASIPYHDQTESEKRGFTLWQTSK